jgi:hypothetical protein
MNAEQVTAEQVTIAKAELAQVRDRWMRRPGVTALDVGLRRKAGQLTDEVAVRVHVSKKRPIDQIPPDERFPSHLGEVPVDVIEASYGPETG